MPAALRSKPVALALRPPRGRARPRRRPDGLVVQARAFPGGGRRRGEGALRVPHVLHDGRSAPGTCPVCGMDMEPVTDGGTQVALGARDRFMAGVRTASVERRQAVHRIRALGKIRYDERREGQVTAWVSGRLDRLFVDFTGVEVGRRREDRRDLRARARDRPGGAPLRAAYRATRPAVGEREGRGACAQRRGRLPGGSQALAPPRHGCGDRGRDRGERGRSRSPRHPRQRRRNGGRRSASTPATTSRPASVLFDVVDLSTVWAMLDVFEEDAGAVFLGQRVEIEVPSLPGEVYARRDLVRRPRPRRAAPRRAGARRPLDNRDRRLKPGSFVDAEILVDLTAGGGVVDPATGAQPGPVLLVPRSAVLEGGDAEARLRHEAAARAHGERRRALAGDLRAPARCGLGLRVGDDHGRARRPVRGARRSSRGGSSSSTASSSSPAGRAS